MDDRAIVAQLKAELGITEEKEDYDDQDCVTGNGKYSLVEAVADQSSAGQGLW